MSLTSATRARLQSIGRTHLRRDPWPDFDAFDPERYPMALRRRAARQWWRRAREEYGSISEFSQLAHTLTLARAPIELLSALSRLITDEARHAHLCAAMAEALASDEPFDWEPPRAPWPDPPADVAQVWAWAADVVICACCLGETLSRPLFECVATLVTDPVPEGVVRQILRDEHLHATFGWEMLAWLRDRVPEPVLQASMRRRFAGFERSCVAESLGPEDLKGELVIAPPDPDAPPNLGHLGAREYAMVFYATLESEVIPRFEALELDAKTAWAERSHT